MKSLAVLVAIVLVLALLLGCAPTKGEPVPGAEVTLEQEPEKRAPATGGPVAGAEIIVTLSQSGTQFAKCVTNKNGEFSFNFSVDTKQGAELPEKLTFDLSITPPKGTNYQLSEGKTNKVTFEVRPPYGPRYECTLGWVPEAGKASRGGFAVSGRSST